jgi:hypothetical protein
VSITEVRWVKEPTEPPKTLWRYVGLSTLLLLIEKGRVYIPTIEELKRGDPTESSIICNHTRKFFETLDPADCKWLLENADSYEKKVLTNGRADETLRVRLQIWTREMAKRRCAWCWYGGSAESMALWQLFAKHGVTIGTTPKKLIACINSSWSAMHAIVGQIQYVDCDKAIDRGPEFLLRPYFFKKECFEHEKEVRVIFPKPTGTLDRGLLLNLKPAPIPEGKNSRHLLVEKLIEQIVISPLLHKNEAETVRDIIVERIGPDRAHLVTISTASDVELSAADELKRADAYKSEIACFGEPKSLPGLLKRDLDIPG